MNYPIKGGSDRYKVYINGEWRDSVGIDTHVSVNPAHKSIVLGHVAECTAGEVDEAMRVADAAFPAWRAVSGNIKTKMFLQVAQILYANYEQIVATMTREMGKSLFDARLLG